MKSTARKPKALKSVLQMLANAKAPSTLGLIISFMMIYMPPGTYDAPRYLSTEMFAGDQAYSDAWREVGEKVASLDIRFGPDQDINSNRGFVMHLNRLLETDLVALLAPVCSTFTQMNLYTSGRSVARPLGNRSRANDAANMMVSRVVLLLWYCCSVGLCFIVEQPAGSLLEQHPRIQSLMKAKQLYKHKISMKDKRIHAIVRVKIKFTSNVHYPNWGYV